MTTSWKIGPNGEFPADLRAELQKHLDENPSRPPGADFPPPWQMFPNIPNGSVGWRMGPGEDYHLDFAKWFAALGEAKQADYISKNPEPAGWQGYYLSLLR